VAETDVQGYDAPYKYLPTKAGSSFPRFAHLALGIPDFFLRRLRETTPWKIFEAISGPSRFTGLNMLALLSERDEKMRCYWQMKQLGDKNVDRVLKTIVLFGERDPVAEGLQGDAFAGYWQEYHGGLGTEWHLAPKCRPLPYQR
jgi:hypothetical protein